MTEPVIDTKKHYFIDPEAQVRFNLVVEEGKRIFEGSGIIDPLRPITREDLHLVASFHKAVDPTNPNHPWRLRKDPRDEVRDKSFYENWDKPGGPLEHITLAGRSAEIIVREIKAHLRAGNATPGVIEKIGAIDPLHTAVAASLHDEGREVTHIFYTTDLIGRGMLKKIGVRKDILDILPGEEIMWTPEDVDMNKVISDLSPEAVVVRIADDYGKRRAGTNRLSQRSDFTKENQERWAASYLIRPESGRPSDRLMRKKMPLHTMNAQRYLDALDNWLQSVTDLTTDDLTRTLNIELTPTLLPLSE